MTNKWTDEQLLKWYCDEVGDNPAAIGEVGKADILSDIALAIHYGNRREQFARMLEIAGWSDPMEWADSFWKWSGRDAEETRWPR